MSTSLHVLLKADPCLEGDVADEKADPSAGLFEKYLVNFTHFFERVETKTNKKYL